MAPQDCRTYHSTWREPSEPGPAYGSGEFGARGIMRRNIKRRRLAIEVHEGSTRRSCGHRRHVGTQVRFSCSVLHKNQQAAPCHGSPNVRSRRNAPRRPPRSPRVRFDVASYARTWTVVPLRHAQFATAWSGPTDCSEGSKRLGVVPTPCDRQAQKERRHECRALRNS